MKSSPTILWLGLLASCAIALGCASDDAEKQTPTAAPDADGSAPSDNSSALAFPDVDQPPLTATDADLTPPSDSSPNADAADTHTDGGAGSAPDARDTSPDGSVEPTPSPDSTGVVPTDVSPTDTTAGDALVADTSDAPSADAADADDDADAISSVDPQVMAALIAQSCGSTPLIAPTNSKLTFNETTQPCPWGQDDNLAQTQQVITARTETSLPLPGFGADQAICELDIQIDEKNLFFDDLLLLLFNDIVLFVSHKDLLDSLPLGEDGLYRYQWSALTNVQFPQGFLNPDAVCAASGYKKNSACDLDPKSQAGYYAMEMEGTETIAQALALDAALNGQALLTLVIAGDDDPTDCQHSSLELMVESRLVPLLSP